MAAEKRADDEDEMEKLVVSLNKKVNDLEVDGGVCVYVYVRACASICVCVYLCVYLCVCLYV